MPVQFVGALSGTMKQVADPGLPRDPVGYARQVAQIYEAAGYDLLLLGWTSTGGDSLSTAFFASTVTERLRFLIAHRTGFIAPTVAARMLAMLDHYLNGRLLLHAISGGSDVEQRRDGDWLDHDARYRRSAEFLTIVRRMWTSPEPFDFTGEFYRVAGAFATIKPLQQPHIPVSFGGGSPAALAVGSEHADIYVLTGEPLDSIRERIARIRALAAPFGRSPEFGLTIRATIAPTERQAWERAFAIAERLGALGGALRKESESSTAQRAAEIIDAREIYDKRFWTGIGRAAGPATRLGETATLVGTPDQVAESLLDYYDAGIRLFFLYGLDLARDPAELGRELFPLVREAVRRRDQLMV
ncbi:MAG: hypothetical protein KatS3mg060_2394 [Dehalococcoidia bacterium]|nr:MAG: hypothetical protein KatS3mg060_2394 [Dehalococcoidia bacterium]